jgi:hypothetical protein
VIIFIKPKKLDNKMDKTLKQSLILFGVGASLVSAVMIGGPFSKQKKSDIKAIRQEYNQMFLRESLTAEDTLEFYKEHGLMSYAVWNYTDLSHAYQVPWKFEPIPDSVMERVIREEKEGKK